MNHKVLFVAMLVAIALGLSVFVVDAQGPKPKSPSSVSVTGTSFTNQGQLKKSGGLVNGVCDMTFSLWDSTSGGTQLGTGQLISAIPVANGLFTAVLNGSNQFGASAFYGDNRWLQIDVQCGADPSPTPLGRQQVTPAPLAYGLVPGATISGTAGTALTAISTASQGTGIIGEADNGSNAWGVYGSSMTGIGVYAHGNDNVSAPNTALKINGGALRIGGAVSPAFVWTAVAISGQCSQINSPLVNGDPNAIIIATPRQDTITVPATDVRVLYNLGIWSLCSPTLASGMEYNMLVINQ